MDTGDDAGKPQPSAHAPRVYWAIGALCCATLVTGVALGVCCALRYTPKHVTDMVSKKKSILNYGIEPSTPNTPIYANARRKGVQAQQQVETHPPPSESTVNVWKPIPLQLAAGALLAGTCACGCITYTAKYGIYSYLGVEDSRQCVYKLRTYITEHTLPFLHSKVLKVCVSTAGALANLAQHVVPYATSFVQSQQMQYWIPLDSTSSLEADTRAVDACIEF
uniref:tRNA (Guanine-N(1)-)-methyltransferase n=1 Tax=Lygus hesperus TaxID=30085 RepID=A0A0A9YPU9_LYGHE